MTEQRTRTIVEFSHIRIDTIDAAVAWQVATRLGWRMVIDDWSQNTPFRVWHNDDRDHPVFLVARGVTPDDAHRARRWAELVAAAWPRGEEVTGEQWDETV